MMRAFAFVGHSGAGKTSLLETLLPELMRDGTRVGVVKHSSHFHPLHPAGSDTERFGSLGVPLVGFAHPGGLQLTHSLAHADSEQLAELKALGPRLELLLIEGWKDSSLPKAEVWRPGLEAPLALTREDILAVISPTRPPGLGARTTWLSPHSLAPLVELVHRWARAL